ncbi:MAG TPA: lipofamily protein [Firmicutes bacterium]|nr:lipofamily protein [Bacillota bacterium]
MKKKSLLFAAILAVLTLGACTQKETTETTPENTDTENSTTTETPDAMTSASQVTDATTLDVAIGNSWIVILKNDVTTDKEIVLNGGFTKDGEAVSRKIALYDQDSDRNKTATYTLTAPKLVINDQDANIKGGTFVGDVYVEAENVSLTDAKVEGNIYFKNEACQNTFTMDETSSVTGVQEVK